MEDSIKIELERQMNEANLKLIEYEYQATRMDYFGTYGVSWTEALGAAIDALTAARDMLQGVFDQITENNNARSS